MLKKTADTLGNPAAVFLYKGVKTALFHIVTPPFRKHKKKQLFQEQNIKRKHTKAAFLHSLIKSHADEFGKHIKNYTHFLALDQHLIFTLAWDLSANKPMGFSGVFNGGRFPKGVYRVLNRTWTARAYRFMSKNLAGLHSRLIFSRHFQVLKHRAKILFFSMEGFSEPKIKITARKLEESGKSPWVIPSGFYKVAPGDQASCWQKTAYTLLDKSAVWPLESKNDANWMRLPENQECPQTSFCPKPATLYTCP